ncbi:MAG TPA: N-acetylmuramoyl-L-alanine amidase [Abditibacteriaceae bacterium]|jgi:N-acetylmuramoyl-L-alanine amidase
MKFFSYPKFSARTALFVSFALAAFSPARADEEVLTPMVGSAPRSETAENTANPTTSMGALPIDLALVKRIRVAGQNIAETPLRVGNLDVLAPIVGDNSQILSRLGASATRVAVKNVPGNINTPSEDQNFQINLPQGAPIVFTIGKATALIEGQEQALRAAPLVMGGKIWLPIYSVAPLLGASVRLASDGTLQVNPTIQSVELFPAKGYTVLTVKASAPLKPGDVLQGTTENPAKLYLDFRGFSMGFDATYSSGERSVSAGLNEVKQVRAGMFTSFPDTTRVVLDLSKEVRSIVQPLPDKTIFALLLSSPGGGKGKPVIDIPRGNGTLRGMKIVVDPGHGGKDGGASGARSKEKNHTLDISRRLRTYLEARGATVLMTREDDSYPSLQARVDFANARRADLFISVHINSFRSTSAGTETFFWTAKSSAFAKEVHKELTKATGLPNRGVTQTRFFVIRKTNMPSILTETAFISNPREEALLVDPAFRDRVARGMAQGIANYVSQYK